MTNTLLSPWDAAFGLPAFDDISENDFAPAFESALAAARARINEIAEADEAPTFANTIEALELADEALSRVASLFFTLVSTDATPMLEALQRDISPKLAKYSSEITMNRALFERIDTLWQQRDDLGLTEEQERVLMLTRRGFVRAGAELEGDDRDRLKEIT